MNIDQINYFKDVQGELTKSTFSKSDKVIESEAIVPIMPLQFMYIHNLKTGQFEKVNGVSRVLGYTDKEFNLELYYKILHDHDKEIVFELTRKSMEWAKNAGPEKSNQMQLCLVQRMKRVCGNYAQILRQSSAYEIINRKIVKTISICTDITQLKIKALQPIYFHLPERTGYNHSEILKINAKLGNHVLSLREKEIIFFLLEGLTSNEIACRLCISKHTVDTHRRKILKKLELKSTFELRTIFHQSDHF